MNTWWRVQVPLANISYLKEKHPSFIVLAFFVVSAMVMYWLFGRFVDSRVFPYYYHIPKILLVFGLIFGCLGFIALAAGALSFFRFSSWRSRLPFDLTGWQKLVDFSEFGNEELWRHCKIELLLSEESPDASAAYQAALMVFSEKANQCYFRANGADQQKEWKADGLTASGSANRHVARKIKQLCEGNLTRLKRKDGFMKEVRITTDPEHFRASRPSVAVDYRSQPYLVRSTTANYRIITTEAELKNAVKEKIQRIIITDKTLAAEVKEIKGCSIIAIAAAPGGIAAIFWDPARWLELWPWGLVGAAQRVTGWWVDKASEGAKVDAIVISLGAAIVWAINLRYRQEQSMKVTLPDGTIVDSELVLER